MKNAVVTGSNRGIGLALCKHLQARGYKVFGACRKPSTELEKLGVHVIPGVDVGVDDGIKPLVQVLASTQVDLLICNAGILKQDDLASISLENMRAQFEVNTLGPLRTVLALKPQLKRGSKVAVVTSRMGCIADGSGGYYGYRVSKTAVNMAFSTLAHDIEGEGIAVGIVHPGFVATDMTASYGDDPSMISTDTSATGMLDVIEKQLSMETTGTFWHGKTGSVLPW